MYEEELMADVREEVETDFALRALRKLSPEVVADLLEIPLERVEVLAAQQVREE